MHYDYCIDLNERGVYSAHVEERESGEVVYTVNDIEELRLLIEDGYMRHSEDMNGLYQHLVELGVLRRFDTLGMRR